MTTTPPGLGEKSDIMYNQNHLKQHEERQKVLMRMAERERLAREARQYRQRKQEKRRSSLARVLSLFL
jgi:hypothetical protein